MQNHFVSYNPKLKDLARQLRNNMTEGEVILWRRLKKKQMMGYDFDRQKPMDQFIVDFYCKSLALAIEVDDAIHDSEEAQQRDQMRQATLESLGVRFLRFKDDDVRHNTNAVCLTIANWIRENQPPSTS